MTIQRFQGLVLKLGNQMYVRHYYWLNYPMDPQEMGIQFPELDKQGKLRLNPIKTKSTPERLRDELRELGFIQRNDGIWSISRTPNTIDCSRMQEWWDNPARGNREIEIKPPEPK